MNRFPRVANGMRPRKQRSLIIIPAMLLMLLLVVPVAALPPVVPFNPDIPDILSAPSNLTATAVSSSEIDLTWQDNCGYEVGFCVERKMEGAGSFENHSNLSGNTTSFKDTGLQPNTTYYYRVKALVANGSTPYSNEASAKTKVDFIPILTKPEAPSNLKVTGTASDTIDLAWKDNSNNEDGFFVHRKLEGAPGFTTIANVGANVTTYKNTGLAPGTKYYYVVSAHNTVGASALCNEVSATTPPNAPATKPLAPTLLTAVPGSDDTRIDITWQNNCTNETGFYIFRKRDGEANFSKVYDGGSGGWTGYGDTGLTPGTTYHYYVSAYNALGSADSNVLSATTTGIAPVVKPNAPADLAAAALSSSQIKLTWKDNSNNESGFILERSLTQADGYAQVTGLPAGSTTYNDTGLSAVTTYFYRVKAFNSAGDSAYSPLASATTPAAVEPQKPDNNQQPPDNNGPTVVLRFYIDKNQYYINDVPSPMEVAPVILEDRTLLPIRFVATPLGAEVGWEQAASKVTIIHNGNKIEMWIGKNTALVNGVQKMIDPDNPQVAPLILPPGRTMLPLRFISENLGCQVDWNDTLREAQVTYPRH